ncbi:MAG: hypothetical protein KC468_34385, partial [Myxococcales bacterium]|nr:hypothetical protein [Myxococcales bacterium]
MDITIVRKPGQRDRIYVARADGSEASWSFPSYGDGLPHDLVHFVVETTFGIERGLWGLVRAGVDIERVNAVANRVGGADKYRALGDLRELMQAEALAVAPWLSPGASDEDCVDAVRRQCEASRPRVEPPRALTLERVAVARARLRE